MGKSIQIKSGKYTFTLDGRSVFINLNDDLGQKYNVQTRDFLKLNQWEYCSLVHVIYGRRITDVDTLGKYIMDKYRLVPTSRNL